jgi:hypothetical protein
VKNESIDVWKVSYDGVWYYSDVEPRWEDLEDGMIITKEKMMREYYESLPEFGGF